MSNSFSFLYSACVLIGIGISALAGYLMDMSGLSFWLLIGMGIGMGKLATFLIGQKYQQQEQHNRQ